VRVLYCHCRYTNILPKDVKGEVLARLAASGRPFEAVADLCELSAGRDPFLTRFIAEDGPVVIAACFARAVHEIFRQGGAPTDGKNVSVLNMRQQSSAEVCGALEV
jgi:hypothetical protein